MSDLFTQASTSGCEKAQVDLFSEYPARAEGEPAGDVGTSEPGSGSAATSPAARGNESSAEQAAGEVGSSGSAEATATRTSPAPAAGCCGSCGEWTKASHGFGFCEHLPRWTTMSPRAECHFNPPRWVPIDPEIVAKREAQARIDRAADAADRHAHGWSDRALKFLKEFSDGNRGRRFIGREIVLSLKTTTLPLPPDDNAYAAVIQRAVKTGVLRKVGYLQGTNRHLSPVPEYESA